MKSKFKSINKYGFAVIGVVITLIILGSMAAGISALVAANQTTRVSQIYTDQAFYISHAAFETALRAIKADKNAVLPARQFNGSNLTLSKASARIYSQGLYGNAPLFAANAFSICDPGTGAKCFYILGSTGTTLSLNGTTNLSTADCGIQVNSSSSSAISVVGNSSITTPFIDVVGGVSGNVNTILVCKKLIPGATSPIGDPLLSYDIPTYGTCDYNNMTVNSSTTLNPGVYCGGLDIKGSGTVTLNPGNYIMDGGKFSITGSANVTGNGITTFLNKQIQSTFATVAITGTGTITLNAPTTGAYSGILFFQSRSATDDTNTINGGSSLNLTGAVYLPKQDLDFRGGQSVNAPCTMFIVKSLSLSGSANIACTTGSLSGLVP